MAEAYNGNEKAAASHWKQYRHCLVGQGLNKIIASLFGVSAYRDIQYLHSNQGTPNSNLLAIFLVPKPHFWASEWTLILSSL